MGGFDYTRIYFCIAALIFDILLCFFTITKYFADKQSKRFRILVIVITGANFLECTRVIVGNLSYTPFHYFIKRVIQSLCYISSTGIAFSFTRYLDSFLSSSTKLRTTLRKINYTIYAAYCILLITNIFTGWVAGYDEAIHKWTYGPLYLYVGYGVPFFFMLSTAVFFFKDIRTMEKRITLTMLASIGMAMLAILIQPHMRGRLLLSSFGISLSIYLWYFAVENYDYRKFLSMIDRLKEAEQRALNANKAKSAFLANMSHEIRTPMNAVLGMDEMILRTDNKAEIDEYARNIQSAGKTLLAIINDILDFSKIESGKMQIIESPYHLAAVLDDVSHIISMRATQKELSFEVDIDSSISDELYGDEVRVRQIMINVLNNAVKYTEKGKVTLKVRGDTSSDNTLMLLQLTISDTGIGIKEKDFANLFNSFERIDEAKNHAVEGSGLGLAIVYHLVKRMNGTIDVKSEYGKGSTFHIELPQRITGGGLISDFKLQGEQQTTVLTEHMIAPNAHFLIVDDNAVNLIVAQGLLKYTKAHITTCKSGEECLELMKKEKYDIIFLDHMMPGIDGVEVLNISKTMEGNRNKETPIIALTANAMAGMREKYLDMGFTDYLSKPINSSLLYELVFRVISPLLIEPAPKEPSEVQKPVGSKEQSSGLTLETKEQSAPEKKENETKNQPVKKEVIFNQEEGLSLCAGDRAMYRELLAIFCEEKSESQAKLVRFLLQEDWKNYTVLVHSIKSSARLIGSIPLSEKAKALECAAKAILEGKDAAAQKDFINESQKDFMHLYNDVAQAARKVLSTP